VLRIGRGIDRVAVRRALERKRPLTVVYRDVLRAEDIREAVAGVRDAGYPEEARPILAWLAAHANAPADVLEELMGSGSREVLMSLALNVSLPEAMRKSLMEHPDEAVRNHAHHVFTRLKRH
jgi:hypothetical protein